MITALLLAATAATSPFDQVVAAERAFAAASARDGLHAAFVANFAPDGVVFDPVPTNGRAAHEGKPRSKGALSWGPAWAAVPAAGDLGFSSGPWEFRVAGDDAPAPSTGWFFTAWRKQPDGTWKVEADLGVSAGLTYAPPSDVINALPPPPAHKPSRSLAAKARLEIAAAEHALATAGSRGLGAAVASVADPAIRVYREGHAPESPFDAAQVLLAADTRKATCSPARVAASASADLGYAYGTCTPAAGGADDKAFGFLRVWHKQPDGTWRVFVDVTP